MSGRGFLCAVAVACVIAGVLAGCGGGGGGGGQTPGPSVGGFGVITGNVSEALASRSSRASEPVTVSVEGTELSTEAASDGSFTIDHVPTGLQTLTARTSSRAAALVVSVERNRETNVGEMRLREAGQISGLVTSSATHQPIPGAVVTITESAASGSDQMPHPVRTRGTDADGSYTVPGLPAGDYVVTASKRGYATQSLSVTVNASATTTGDFALAPVSTSSAGSLKGTVSVRSEDGSLRPLAGVLVRVARPDDPDRFAPVPDTPPAPPALASRAEGDRDYCAFTGADGAYLIEGIPAGTYLAIAVRPGMQHAQASVTITANQTTTQDFTLEMPRPQVGVVEGTVTDSTTGDPISGAKVTGIVDVPPPMPVFSTRGSGVSASGGSLITPDTGEVVMETRTDSSGHYRLLVPEVVTAIRARAEGYVTTDVPVEVRIGGSVTANIAMAPLAPKQVTLSGQVTMRSQGGAARPVAGATVYAIPEASDTDGDSAEVVFTDVTDDDGRYSISLQPGRYTVRASKNDFVSVNVSMAVREDTVRNFLLERDIPPPPPPPF